MRNPPGALSSTRPAFLGPWAFVLSTACASEPPPAAPAPAPVVAVVASDPTQTVTIDRGGQTRLRRAAPEPAARGKRLIASPGLEILGCDREGEITSREASQSVMLDLVNRTAAPVHVYWLGYDGSRVLYAELPREGGYAQQTYVTHPWVFTDDDERCIGIAVPTAAPSEAIPLAVVGP